MSEGLATESEMAAMATAWREWASEEDGVFYYTNGQALATVT